MSLAVGLGFLPVVAGVLDVPSIGACRADDGLSFNTTTFLLNKRPVPGDAAVCNDGSAAQFYFRPCCDGTAPGDKCDVSPATWLVVFGDGNEDGWCWDAASCAARMAANPALTGSAGLEQTLNQSLGGDSGAFSKGGEVNPNFYKSYAVYVPYCSSDLFLGECDSASGSELHPFCGKSIAESVLRSLLPEMAAYGADSIVLVGGAGLMSYVDELVDILPSSAQVSAVCDGCILLDDALQAQDGQARGSAACEVGDAFACTPDRTLPSAVELWGATLATSCGGWRCLLSTVTPGQPGLVARTAGKIRLLAQHPLYDARAYQARGVSPGDDSVLDEAVRTIILSILDSAQVAVGGACAGPSSAFTKAEFFSVIFGHTRPSLSYASGLYDLVHQLDRALVDTCDGLECNPTCSLVDRAPTALFA